MRSSVSNSAQQAFLHLVLGAGGHLGKHIAGSMDQTLAGGAGALAAAARSRTTSALTTAQGGIARSGQDRRAAPARTGVDPLPGPRPAARAPGSAPRIPRSQVSTPSSEARMPKRWSAHA